MTFQKGNQFAKGNKPNKTSFKKGQVSPNKGKHISWMIGKNNPNYGKDMSGSNAPNWKGGVSVIDRLIRRMKEYNQWRSDVFERDNWTCQTCGLRGYVTAHHIKGLHKIIKENNIKSILDARKCNEIWYIENGVTLCEECHKLTDNYSGKNKRTSNYKRKKT